MRRVVSYGPKRGPGVRRPKCFPALLFAGVLMLLSLEVAAMRRIDPGEDPKLAPDEGLVVLSVDASSKVSSVHVRHAGGGTAEVLNYMEVGRNLRLYATKAGEYQWDQIMLENWAYRSRFDLDSDEYRFKVMPDWLESQHAALYQRLPFGYSGLYPDPFPEYYRTIRLAKKEPADQLNGGRAPPKPGDLPLPAALMWKPNYVSDFALNPAGDLLAESVRDDNGNRGLNLIDLKAGFAQRVETTAQAMSGLVWKDDRTLIVYGGGEERVTPSSTSATSPARSAASPRVRSPATGASSTCCLRIRATSCSRGSTAVASCWSSIALNWPAVGVSPHSRRRRSETASTSA
jgi:hypothetical protein